MRYRGDGTGTSRPEGQPQQGPLCKCRACTAPNPSRPSCRNALLNAHLRGSPAKVTECACEVYTTYVGAGRGAEVKRVCRTAVQLQSCRPPRSLIRVVQTEGRITAPRVCVLANVCTCVEHWWTRGTAHQSPRKNHFIVVLVCSPGAATIVSGVQLFKYLEGPSKRRRDQNRHHRGGTPTRVLLGGMNRQQRVL